MKEKEKQH